MEDVYQGNAFSITHIGGDWTIWRICDDEGNREQIILTDAAMGELADYFADYYDEDSARPGGERGDLGDRGRPV